MKENRNNILPGIGLGKIQFGMLNYDVLKLIGIPNVIEISSYTDWPNDKFEDWQYGNDELLFSFNEEDNWRLDLITINSGDYNLEGVIYLNQEMNEVKSKLEALGFEHPQIEDWSNLESPDHKLLCIENKGMNFWFDDKILTEIQWSPLFKDDDTAIWPYKSENPKRQSTLGIKIYDSNVLFDKLEVHLDDWLNKIFSNKKEYVDLILDFPIATERENLSTKSTSIKYYIKVEFRVEGAIFAKARLIHNEKGDIGWMAVEWDNELNILDDFLVIVDK